MDDMMACRLFIIYDDMMFVCYYISHLVLFFKHFERMRLLVGHIYALQAVDVPGKDDRDKDDGEDDDDMVLHIDLFIISNPSSCILLWKAGFGDMCLPGLNGFDLTSTF